MRANLESVRALTFAWCWDSRSRVSPGRRVVMLTASLALTVAVAPGCGHDEDERTPTHSTPTQRPTDTATATPTASALEWSTYGGSQLRTFFNAYETRITRASVATLRQKWVYETAAI